MGYGVSRAENVGCARRREGRRSSGRSGRTVASHGGESKERFECEDQEWSESQGLFSLHSLSQRLRTAIVAMVLLVIGGWCLRSDLADTRRIERPVSLAVACECGS